MPEPALEAMQAAIEERYGVRWEDLEMARVAPRLSAPALVIHDRDDRMMPWTQGATVARALARRAPAQHPTASATAASCRTSA